MAIRTVITRGFGNGTFNGTIALVVPRGYISGDAAPPVVVAIRTDIGVRPGMSHYLGRKKL